MEGSASAMAQPPVLGGLQALLAKRPIILQFAKFICIGLLNTALDFLLLNLFSQWFDIQPGRGLGMLNLLTFSAATIQSYFWNRAWAFGGDSQTLGKQFWRLVTVGSIGFVGLVLAIVLAFVSTTEVFPTPAVSVTSSTIVFIILTASFLIAELAAWMHFGLAWQRQAATVTFAKFLAISLVGLAINSGVVALVSAYLADGGTILSSPEAARNASKILATGLSLVWNFLGYKFIVFRK